MKQPVIVDLRNIYDPVRMSEEGFTYIGVGRGAKWAAPNGD
jgi:UDPglucose 6-dehydrogenase